MIIKMTDGTFRSRKMYWRILWRKHICVNPFIHIITIILSCIWENAFIAAFIENCENAHNTLIFAENDSCKNSKLPQISQNMFISNLHKLSPKLNKVLRLTIKSISTYYKYHKNTSVKQNILQHLSTPSLSRFSVNNSKQVWMGTWIEEIKLKHNLIEKSENAINDGWGRGLN